MTEPTASSRPEPCSMACGEGRHEDCTETLEGRNLNEHVFVRLTPSGDRMWADAYLCSGAFFTEMKARATDAEGRTRFQLWELMRMFGPHLHTGFTDLLFVGNAVEFVSGKSSISEAREYLEGR